MRVLYLVQRQRSLVGILSYEKLGHGHICGTIGLELYSLTRQHLIFFGIKSVGLPKLHRYFTKGKNTFILHYEYNGWAFLCKYILGLLLNKCMARTGRHVLLKNEIRTIDWPSNSPDLNPIENMWHIVKNKGAKKY